MFDNRPQSEVDLEDEMVNAIKRRAVTGTETPADVARINAGSNWLSGGMQANVAGSGQRQVAQTELDRQRSSMAELQKKAEADQQLEDTRQTGLTGRSIIDDTGTTFRQEGVNKTNLGTTGIQADAQKYGYDVQGRSADLTSKRNFDLGLNTNQAHIGVADIGRDSAVQVANIGLEREKVRGSSVVSAAEAKGKAQQFAATQGKSGREVEALVDSYAKQVDAIGKAMYDPPVAAQMIATARQQFETDLARLNTGTTGTVAPPTGAPGQSPLIRNPAGI